MKEAAIKRFILRLLRLDWITARDTGVWLYEENAITGRRRVTRIGIGHQPIDQEWLAQTAQTLSRPPRRANEITEQIGLTPIRGRSGPRGYY